MAAYPSGYTFGKRSRAVRISNVEQDFAVDGTYRARLFDQVIYYQLEIRHYLLSEAEMITLRDFYESNVDGVSVNWPDGETYTGALTSWEAEYEGYRWNVSLALIGTKD